MFEKLIGLSLDPSVATKAAMQRIAVLVDLAGDLKRDEGTARALEWCDKPSKRRLTNRQSALLDQFRANAWAKRALPTMPSAAGFCAAIIHRDRRPVAKCRKQAYISSKPCER